MIAAMMRIAIAIHTTSNLLLELKLESLCALAIGIHLAIS